VLVDQLVERGLVKTFADLYKLKAEDIANINSEVEQEERRHANGGEKIANKVVANIQNSRAKPLDRLLADLDSARGESRRARAGEAFWFARCDDQRGAEQLSGVNEIGPVIAQSVYDFFHNPAGWRC